MAPRVVRALLSALLALPPPGDLPRDVAVVRRHGRGRPTARARGRRGEGRPVDPGVGRGTPDADAHQPAGLVHLPAEGVGCADPGDGLRGVRRGAADRADGREGGGGVPPARRGRVVRAPDRGVPPRRACLPGVRRARVRTRARHPGRVVRLGLEPRGRARTHRGTALAGRPLHRGVGPVPRLVPELAAGGPRDPGPGAVPRRRHPRLLRGRAGTQDVQVARQHDRARGDHQQERRRDSQAVGVDGGLPGGDARREGNPRAGGRGLPQAAQHAAHPRGEPLRLRPRHRRAADRPTAGARPLRPRALRRGGVARACGPTRTTTSPRCRRRSTA